jgi:hypothetical protein
MTSLSRLQLAQTQIAAIRERRSISALPAPTFYRSRDPQTGWRYWAATEGSISQGRFVGNAKPDRGSTLGGNEVIGR